MKSVATVLGVALCLAACGPKEAPAERELEPAKEVTPAKSGRVDPGAREESDEPARLDEVGGEGAGDAEAGPENATSAGGRTLVVELTAEQREELERQRRENRSRGGTDVTVAFTADQLKAIREVCPECRETSITWHTDRVGVRVKLYFDDAGRIIRPFEPFPYASR